MTHDLYEITLNWMQNQLKTVRRSIINRFLPIEDSFWSKILQWAVLDSVIFLILRNENNEAEFTLIKSVANIKLRMVCKYSERQDQYLINRMIWKEQYESQQVQSNNFNEKEKSQVQRWVSLRDLRSILNFDRKEWNCIALQAPLGYYSSMT